MSRAVLLVGGHGQHRRAVRETLRAEGIAAVEAEGAQPALALVKDSAFDAVVVTDEPRRLALQGLFAQLKRSQPVPAVFLLPLPDSDKVPLRQMAGATARFLDPNSSPDALARAILEALGVETSPAGRPWELGPLIEHGRALDLFLAERRGDGAVFLAQPSEAMRGDAAFGAELVRGASIAARISSPHLPRVVEVGDAQQPFVASAYAPGIPLDRLSKRLSSLDHAFTPAGAVALAAELMSALEVIHDAKLIHGALSPRAIWACDDGQVLLLHAGYSRHVHVVERGMHGSNLQPMRLEYETPESVTDGTLDSRSDLFAVGVVLWELLACERLFARSDEMSTLDAIREAEVAPLPANVPPAFRGCVEHLLARDPDARPRSAAAARADLLAALKAPNAARAQSGVFGRLFGKRPPPATPVKRLGVTDPRAERAALVRLAAE